MSRVNKADRFDYRKRIRFDVLAFGRWLMLAEFGRVEVLRFELSEALRLAEEEARWHGVAIDSQDMEKAIGLNKADLWVQETFPF